MRSARTFSSLSICLLLLLAAFPAWVGPAAAQQQEKRIALVVGDGAYANAPLATAANDAGLIAQTLQAAGFDVIGARDLDGDTLRKSFRDFIQKAESSGPNTVAMVYLAGYGVQLAGENYFIPVDSNITRDTDIPIEGLRMSDYTRQLGALPLKASIVVLDAGRQQPFIAADGQQQIASGLALVEPENNMLIAYNAAPGTVAPTESGDYGIYAQALAEMIRTGGLTLPDVFDRVRLRVNENSKGALVPWDAQKITAQFSFFDRAPDAPPVQGPADQVAAIRDKPIRDLPARDAYAASLERDSLQGYEDFVAAYPSDAMAPRVRAIIAARREAITWRRTYLADSPQAYWSYLRRYPHGPHAWDCRRRLVILNAALEPPPSFAVLAYDVPPPPPDEIVIVDRPVVYFGDPVFGFAPPPPPPVFFLPPPPPDFVVLPAPFAPVGLFILPQPRFVPIPVYVRPPVYVAPPPNNIIYNNIHNTTIINNVINQPPPQVAANNPQAAAAAAASGKPVGAAPPPPPSVHQAALAIQKSPTVQLTPSQQAFVAHPTAKPGTPGLIRTNAPAAAPAAPAIPPQNALPGAKTGTPLPQAGKSSAPAAAAPNANPNARLAPSQTLPGTTPPKPGTAAPSANLHPAPPPGAKGANQAGPGKPPVESQQKHTPQPPTAKLTPSTPPGAAHPPPAAAHAPPPATAHVPPPAAAHVPPAAAAHAPPPATAHAPPPPAAHRPPPAVAHAAPPPPHPAPPPPAPHPGPPPVAHAAPPPPRPAPPPPAPHPAPPPMAHAAAPPPHAAPPPPRPPAAAPKRCKPGEKC